MEVSSEQLHGLVKAALLSLTSGIELETEEVRIFYDHMQSLVANEDWCEGLLVRVLGAQPTSAVSSNARRLLRLFIDQELLGAEILDPAGVLDVLGEFERLEGEGVIIRLPPTS